MKICKTADIHIGVPNKLDDIMWALRKIRARLVQDDIRYWVNLGDLTHDRETLNLRDLCTLSDFLDETQTKFGIKFISFPGNHDMFHKNTWDINSLTPLRRIIECHNKVSMLTLGGVRFWILPFVHYETKYMEYLAKIEAHHKPGDVLWTHIGIKNASLNTCFLLKSWSIVEFTNSKFDQVYTGHFHTHQQVGHNVWYPGSPIPFKFDEGDVDHGFFIYDTDTRTHEFVSIWDGITKDETTPPQFLTLNEETIAQLTEDDLRGNLVRVAYKADHTHNQKLELKEHLLNLGARDVRWMTSSTKEDKEGVVAAKAAAASASELFTRLIESDVDGTKALDKALLQQMSHEAVAEGDRRYEFTGEVE